jgi:hypothetical protein
VSGVLRTRSPITPALRDIQAPVKERLERSSRADPWSKTRRGAWIARQLILECLLERRKRQPRGSFADCDGGWSPALTLVDGHAGYPAFNAPKSAREHE